MDPPPPPPPSSEISVDPNKSSPPSLSALSSGKICIVTQYGLMEKTYYAVFIVDLASPSISPVVEGGFIPSAPLILLDLDFDSPRVNFYTVSLFNSTLYLFEKGRFALHGPRKWKSVFSYDLSPHLDRKEDQPVVVTKNMLTPAPDMLSPKNCPLAIPTPDRKRILLLSAQFCYEPGYVNTDEIGSVDFELFNPADKKEPWKKLPSLHEFLEKKKIGAKGAAGFYLDSYGFIADSTFLISFKLGIFTIDVDEEPEPVWKKIGGRSIDVPFNGPVFGIEGDDEMLLLATSHAYEMSNGCDGDVMFRPISSPFGSSIGKDFAIKDRLWNDLNTIYDKHGRLFGFVKLRLARDKQYYAHMFLDVFSFNLDKYRNDKKIVGNDAHLEPSLIKSFKFVINRDKCFLFSPRCVSLIQQGTK